MNEKNIISVCYACSEQYAPYLATTLISLLVNLDKQRELNLHILTEDFSEKSKKKINKLKKYHNFNIEYHYIKDSDYDFLTSDIKCPVHVSRVAASRILLPKILPDLDKILVLECDQMVNDDISKLFDTDIENYSMAAVEDFASVMHSRDLWSEKSEYYNGGVILLNLKKLRDIDYLTIFKEKISKNGSRYRLQEQDIWNDGLRFDIKRLNIRWNLYHCFYPEDMIKRFAFVPKDETEYEVACAAPGIYHFVSEDKCWFPTVEKPYIAKYREYEKMSPFFKYLKWHKYKLENRKYLVFTVNGKVLLKFTKKKKVSEIEYKFLERIFSIKNTKDRKQKVLTILGIKIKFKKPETKTDRIIKEQRKEIAQLKEFIYQTSWLPQKVASLHQRVFPQFHNIHINDEIAVVGCGPTLNYYEPIKNVKHIALNRSIRYNKVKFDYAFTWDLPGIEKDEPEFFSEFINYDCIKFVGKFLHDNAINPMDLNYEFKNKIYRCYSASRSRFGISMCDPVIHADISIYPLADFMSIAFGALNFAAYTHPKRIYLVGLDTKQTQCFDGNNHQYFMHELTRGYKLFKSFFERCYPDTEIVSVNPVGLKGMFRDIYTKGYVEVHPELLKENVEILDETKEKELIKA